MTASYRVALSASLGDGGSQPVGRPLPARSHDAENLEHLGALDPGASFNRTPTLRADSNGQYTAYLKGYAGPRPGAGVVVVASAPFTIRKR